MSDPRGVSQPDVPASAGSASAGSNGSRVLTLNRGSSSIKFAVYAARGSAGAASSRRGTDRRAR